MSFQAVTYNVLAQSYIRPDRYPGVPPEHLEPVARQKRLVAHIVALDADLLCLQEVEPAFLADLERGLGPGHTTRYAQREGRPDGCAIITRDSAFTLTECDTLRYTTGDQLALIVQLSHAGEALAVASTHLRWQPRSTPPQQHIGHRQLQELITALEATGTPARIIAGDLNAISQSIVISGAEVRGMAISCRSQRPWDTICIGGRRRKIDYLLHTPDTLSPAPGQLPRLSRDTLMPSATQPSDHLALSVRFQHSA
jgi:endonuclease/exonuclease/phosphatase (EEP) superfamily protein YafD